MQEMAARRAELSSATKMSRGAAGMTVFMTMAEGEAATKTATNRAENETTTMETITKVRGTKAEMTAMADHAV